MPPPLNVGRQAIVIIHGIGEQRPMSTLRSFCKTLQSFERTPEAKMAWSKPDTVSQGFEHHRLTLPSTRTRPVTDVYELYWAHLFEQRNLSTFLAWITTLVTRPLGKLPHRYRSISLAIWGGLAFILGLALLVRATVPAAGWSVVVAGVPIVVALFSAAANHFILGTISDAARYLDATPRNVEARNSVRNLGVDFLVRLHQSDRNYDRIVLCGHSLGAVIGYDILRYAWYRMHEEHNRPERPAQKTQKDAAKLSAAQEGAAFRALQRDLWLEQAALGNAWRVSDFVTLGSPLAHADLLMAESAAEFQTFIDGGELPACPPAVDPKTGDIGFKRSYHINGGHRRTLYLLRHSSVFGPVRWTNLYFKTRFGLFGDPLGGPVAPLVANGIEHVPPEPAWPGTASAHTRPGQKAPAPASAAEAGLPGDGGQGAGLQTPDDPAGDPPDDPTGDVTDRSATKAR